MDDDGRETLYVADFYCAEAKLIVEIDGPIHNFTRNRDAARSKTLEERGLSVLRFRNEEIEKHLDEVLEKIVLEL